MHCLGCQAATQPAQLPKYVDFHMHFDQASDDCVDFVRGQSAGAFSEVLPAPTSCNLPVACVLNHAG